MIAIPYIIAVNYLTWFVSYKFDTFLDKFYYHQ